MSKVYQLSREQILPVSLEQAWSFISSPKNLDRITPDDMSFEIVSPLPDAMYEGLLIEYRVGIPLIGKQTWLTELKHIRENHSFVDEQRIGPYRFWYHYHQVTEVAEGVRFDDRVCYIMPFGVLGALVHATWVENQLNSIFDYRHAAMERYLGAP